MNRQCASAWSCQKSFTRVVSGAPGYPSIKVAIRCRASIARRFNGLSCATSGLPAFSRSSSNRSDGCIVAYPAGRLFLLAKDRAEFSNRKRPPDFPFASRATQKPSLLRPMKNCGIAVADDAGIERLKRRGDRRGLYSRHDAGTLAVLSGRNGRTRPQLAPRKVRCGIKSSCGHGGLLTNPTVLMCR